MLKKTNETENLKLRPATFNEMVQKIITTQTIVNGQQANATDGREGCIRIQNDTGSDLPPLSIIPFLEIRFSPESSGYASGDYHYESDFFSGLWAVKSTTISAGGDLNRFAVAQETIPAGYIGWCRVTGVTEVKVTLESGVSPSTTSMRAHIIPGDNSLLRINNHSGAEVLYINNYDGTTGEYYALVNLGRMYPTSFLPGVAKASITSGSTGEIKETLADGTEKGTNFDAVNLGSDIASGDTLAFGSDRNGNAFFLPAEAGGCSGTSEWYIDWNYYELEEGTWYSRDTGYLCFTMGDACSEPGGLDGTWTGDSGDWRATLTIDGSGNESWSINYIATGYGVPGGGWCLYAVDGSSVCCKVCIGEVNPEPVKGTAGSCIEPPQLDWTDSDCS